MKPAARPILLNDPDALEQVKARYLGKTGQITELMKGLGEAAARREDRRRRHQPRQRARSSRAQCAREAIKLAALEARLAEGRSTSRCPAVAARGGLHPVTRTLERIEACSVRSASRSPTAPRSRPTSTTSPR